MARVPRRSNHYHPCATALTTVTSAAIGSTGPGSYIAAMGLVPAVIAGRGVRTGTYRYSARSAAGGDSTNQPDRLNKHDHYYGLYY